MRLSLLCLISLGLLALGCSKDEAPANEAAAEQPASEAPMPEPAPAQPAVETTADAEQTNKGKLLMQPQVIDEETREELADTIGTLVRPIYPQSLRDQSLEGEAVVEFNISPEGKISNASVLSATHPLFAEAALEAVKQWTFRSASGEIKVTQRRMRQAFPFVINRPDPDDIHGESKGYPVLGGVLRPPHTGVPGRALVELHLDRTSVVNEVKILESDGEIDEEMIQMALKEWLFLPYFKDGSYQPVTVLTELVFTEGGNVLVQYPYNANASSAAAK